MNDVKPITTPMVSGPILSAGELFHDTYLYRNVVDALQYATITHPEISYCINKACQFMHSPKIIHWQLVKRIFKYLKGVVDHDLLLTCPTNLSLHEYADADWDSDPDDKKSTSDFYVFLGGNLMA